MVSFAVLLFSFAVVMLGYQSEPGAPIFNYYAEFHVFALTFPALWYQVLGAIAIVGSLFLIGSAFPKKWREHVEEVVSKRAYSQIKMTGDLLAVKSRVRLLLPDQD
jgi:hypothetical protein